MGLDRERASKPRLAARSLEASGARLFGATAAGLGSFLRPLRWDTTKAGVACSGRAGHNATGTWWGAASGLAGQNRGPASLPGSEDPWGHGPRPGTELQLRRAGVGTARGLLPGRLLFQACPATVPGKQAQRNRSPGGQVGAPEPAPRLPMTDVLQCGAFCPPPTPRGARRRWIRARSHDAGRRHGRVARTQPRARLERDAAACASDQRRGGWCPLSGPRCPGSGRRACPEAGPVLLLQQDGIQRSDLGSGIGREQLPFSSLCSRP